MNVFNVVEGNSIRLVPASVSTPTMLGDSWHRNMRLFLEAIRSCNLWPERWGKREGSCILELAQFEVTIVVIISTAGLEDRAS